MKMEPQPATRRTELEAVLSRVLPLKILSRWRPRGDGTPQALCLTALAGARGGVVSSALGH